ncbi:MAG: nucleoside permease [Bacteroidota bacterium]
MSTRFRLTVVSFLEFFAWGSWLISFGGYLIHKLGFTGGETGAIYGTQGVAALFMPALLGTVADRWVNLERLFGICHLFAAVALLWASAVSDFQMMYWAMLLNALAFMPTLALSNSLSYTILEKDGFDIVKSFPPIRVWGTIGFILAMWLVDLAGWSLSPNMLFISAGASAALGLFSFTLPKCPPVQTGMKLSWMSAMGLDALVLFKNRRMAIFFVFSMLLGAALQITNIFGEAFLHDFTETFPDSFAVKHPGLLMSISQISETVFILTIPFFVQRFGIKVVMLMSMFAWALRFSSFALGDPGDGLPFLVFSMIIYGMAFDFFNISGSLFIRMESDKSIISRAQGLFTVLTNGLGSFLGALGSGWVVNHFTVGTVRDWPSIWFIFAAYALVLGVVFPFVFKKKPESIVGAS